MSQSELGITPTGWQKVFGTTIFLTGLCALAQWGPPALMPVLWVVGLVGSLYCGWKLVR